MSSIGIFLYAIRWNHPFIRFFWKAVPLILATHFVMEGMKDASQVNISMIFKASIWLLGILVFYPAIRANMLLGFPPESWLWRAKLESHLIAFCFLFSSLLFILVFFTTALPLPNIIGLCFMGLLSSVFRIYIFPENKIKSFILAPILGSAIYALVSLFLLRPYIILEYGMSPGIRPYDKVLVTPRIKDPERSDTIVFGAPSVPGRFLVNRVAGLPEETVEIRDGKVFINGSPTQDRPFDKNYYYNHGPYGEPGKSIKVPTDSYFVLGDNSIQSEDSRYFGFVSQNKIQGTVVLVAHPLISEQMLDLVCRFFKIEKKPIKKEEAKVSYDLTFYYQHPEPQKVAPALKAYLNSDNFLAVKFEENTSLLQMAYLFGRIARLSPEILPQYHKLFLSANHNQRKFLIYVLQFGGNNSTRLMLEEHLDDPDFAEDKEWMTKALSREIPLPLQRVEEPVQDSNDLDIQWSEFMITGDTKPVERILDVFAWKDGIREKLKSYLKKGKKDERVLGVLKDRYNIAISNHQIQTSSDLDIIMGMDLVNGGGQKPFQIVKEALKIGDEDVMHAAIKSAAFWATSSNAQQHEKVFETVQKALRTNSLGSEKHTLLKVTSRTALEKGRPAEAVPYLESLIELDPFEDKAPISLFSVYLENNQIEKAETMIEKIRSINPEKAEEARQKLIFERLTSLVIPSEAKEINGSPYARQFMKAKETIKSYASNLRILFRNNEGTTEQKMQWQFKHVFPDRYDVEQQDTDTADKWISIKNENYLFFGFWVKEPSGSDIAERQRTHEIISLQKYFTLVEGRSPVITKEFDFDRDRMLWMRFEKVDNIMPQMADSNPDLELFIDEKGRPRKAVLRWEKERITFLQVFDYPEKLEISAPETVSIGKD